MQTFQQDDNVPSIEQIDAALEQGDPTFALRLASQYLKHNPRDTFVLRKLAMAQFDLGLLDDCANSLRTAVQIEPDNVKAQAFLGNVLMEQEHFAQALPHLELANKLDPDNALLLSLLGESHCYVGFVQKDKQRFAKGLALLEKAVAHAPEEALYKNELAHRYINFATFDWLRDPEDETFIIPIEKAHIETAVTYTEKASQLNPTNKEIQQEIKDAKKMVKRLNRRRFAGRITPGLLYIVIGALLSLSADPWALPVLFTGIAYFVAMRAPIYLLNQQLFQGKDRTFFDRIYANTTNLSNHFTYYGTSVTSALIQYNNTRFGLRLVAICIASLFLPLITLYGFYQNYWAQR